MIRFPRHRAAIAAAACLSASSVASSLAAQATPDSLPKRLPPVVTVTRDVERSPLDLPFAITSLRPDTINPGQAHMFVAQTLSLLPGVTVADRTNPSQDTRVSIRGFGARSQFGARSIRIMRDGMPLTLPDGQTPIDYLDLETVGRVEVIRGPASALYGNASGGVIDLRTIDAPDVPLSVQARSWAGSGNMHRYVGLLGGTAGPFAYTGNIGRTETDGFRQYSQQRLTNAFARVTSTFAATDFALIGMGMDEPVADNPGALTLAQADSAPQQADLPSVQKKTRKAVHQVQVGLQAHRSIGSGGDFNAQVYGGTRSLYNPLTFATVGVGRHQGGAGARLTVPAGFGTFDNRVSVGADAQWVNDHRQNWANCNGLARPTATCPTIDVDAGAISLDQNELVSSFGPYVRDEFDLGRVRASAGVRNDEVRFQLKDHYLGDGRDDSGLRILRAVSPMVGLAARLDPLHSLYANVGSAFETPTTTELGNQPDGSAGLNPDLKPQYSTTYEVGGKGLVLARVQYDVALFDTEVRDELIPYEVPGGAGRTYYRNAGRTRRQGVELSGSTDAGPMTFTASYAFSNFKFRDFLNDSVQYAGNRIPGIPEHQMQAAATYHFSRGFIVAEGLGKSHVFVNDANAASAPSFAVYNLRAGGTAVFGRPWLSPVVAVENLFDRHYIGSVAVNAAGATVAATKFYEPAPGRTWYVGLSAATSPW